MKANRSVSRSAAVALVSLVLAAAGAEAGAQSSADSQKISVEASVVVISQGKYSPTGIEQTVSLSRTVQYGDLNLATSAGARELENRISDTATAVCTDLGARYPASSVGAERADRNACINQAVNNAMKQVKLIVASAEAAQR
jgi:UrcA family protein